MVTISGLQNLENMLAKVQGRPVCEVRAGVFPKKTFMPVLAMYNRLENEIIFNKELIYDADESAAVVTLIHESRHAYQWDRINHPRRAIETKDILDQWRKDFEKFSLLDPEQNEDTYLKMAVEIDAIAYTHLTIEILTSDKTLIPDVIRPLVNDRMDVIKKTEKLVVKKEGK